MSKQRKKPDAQLQGKIKYLIDMTNAWLTVENKHREVFTRPVAKCNSAELEVFASVCLGAIDKIREIVIRIRDCNRPVDIHDILPLLESLHNFIPNIVRLDSNHAESRDWFEAFTLDFPGHSWERIFSIVILDPLIEFEESFPYLVKASDGATECPLDKSHYQHLAVGFERWIRFLADRGQSLRERSSQLSASAQVQSGKANGSEAADGGTVAKFITATTASTLSEKIGHPVSLSRINKLSNKSTCPFRTKPDPERKNRRLVDEVTFVHFVIKEQLEAAAENDESDEEGSDKRIKAEQENKKQLRGDLR